MNELILYAFKNRSRAERVLWALQELQLPHRVVRLNYSKDENNSAEYLQLNPTGKVPTLVNGDFVLTESMAICFYLCGISDSDSLVPTDEIETAIFYQCLFFGVTEVEPYLWLSDKERFIKDEEIPRGVADFSIRKVTNAFRSINHWLEGNPYIAGNTFTLVDILYYYLITWSSLYDIEPSTATKDYLGRLEARDALPRTMTTSSLPAR